MTTATNPRAAQGSSTRPRALVVICPTEYGGQIEHAAEIAAAAVRVAGFARCVVVTRPGGAAAVAGWQEFLSVEETLQSRRPVSSRGRALRQVIDSQKDRRAIRAMLERLQRTHDVTVFYESSKYGIIRTRRRLRSVAFVHNAMPHASAHMTVRDRVLFSLERRMSRHADRVAVHGHRQAERVARWSATPIINVPLPGDSRPVPSAAETEAPYALCIGEVRPNKGIEQAIAAARKYDIRLRVMGTPEPAGYGEILGGLERGAATSIELGYLEAAEFNSTLARAAVVVLPYTSFAAQSGVLAKAVQYARQIVASDLPSLREQAGSYPHIEFVAVGDPDRLGAEMVSAMERSSFSAIDTELEGRAWDDVARSLFA
ncbi:glycosyltransferase involved in cell wall biosynthesis [Microbacterium sp. BE35]|uniref:glycosyltransferase n=1 Tax=Microbacterium sp. BE35 TaxID=2817773 RepID=UPI002862FF2E|nr:glycosyltransferase [Microbacterium sp. BE35]MDR7188700.1 glycosyltransferase involved in cell wall biosynthesis [Microbacterium sp. BE35]